MTAGMVQLPPIEQDATYNQTITVSVNGSPLNITGYTSLFTINYSLTSGATGSFSIRNTWSTNGWILNGGNTGVFTLLIPASTTKTFQWQSGTYDMQYQTADGQTTTRLIQGGINCNPAISQIV